MTKNDGASKGPEIMPDWKKVFVNREEFLKLVSISFSGVIAALAATPVVALLLNYLFVPKALKWVNLGPARTFNNGETVRVSFRDPCTLPWDGVVSKRAVWLRRDGEEDFKAFAVNCTHLGCPVRWQGNAQLFMCPCHGGVYYKDGTVAGGPPPRPLHQYSVRLNGGDVFIQVGNVFTEI